MYKKTTIPTQARIYCTDRAVKKQHQTQKQLQQQLSIEKWFSDVETKLAVLYRCREDFVTASKKHC